MPRTPNPRTEACFVTATLSPLSNQQQTVTEFKKERFQHYAPSHGSAIVTGSTFQNTRAQGKTHVLDGSAILYNSGECGERTGVVMALADGSGKDLDPSVTLSIGLVAKAACDRVVSEARCNYDATQLATAAVNAGRSSTVAKQHPNHVASSTLLAAAINSENGSFVNIGDGVLIVIDGTTLQVKKILNPKQFPAEARTHAPMSAQSLANLSEADLEYFVSRETSNLHPGDIVVLASDGFSDVLPHKIIEKPNPKGPQYGHTLEFEIDIAELNRRLDIVFTNLKNDYPNTPPPAFVVANSLVDVAVSHSLQDGDAKFKFLNNSKRLIEQFTEDQMLPATREYARKIYQAEEAIARDLTVKKLRELLTAMYVFKSNLFMKTDNGRAPRPDLLETLVNKLKESSILNGDKSGQKTSLNERQRSEIIHAVLKNILSTGYSPEDVEKTMNIVKVVFAVEFAQFSQSIQFIEESKIIEAIKTFLNSLENYDYIKLGGIINQANARSEEFSSAINSWLNRENNNSGTLEEYVVKFFVAEDKSKDINNVEHRRAVKAIIAPLLPMISYFNTQLDAAKLLIDKPVPKTVNDFKEWLVSKNSTGAYNEYLTQLNEVLSKNANSRTARIEDFQKFLDKDLSKTGDDISIAVAYVPDPALEFVRAMIEFPAHRPNLLVKLNGLNPAPATLHRIYELLLHENYVLPVVEINREHAQQTVGQTTEKLSQNIVRSYSKEEILNIRFYLEKLLPKLTVIQRIDELQTKCEAQDILKRQIMDANLNVSERCDLYKTLTATHFAKLNEHRRAGIDSFFGINNTSTWSVTLKEIRDHSLEKLIAEKEALISASKFDEVLELLNHSLKEPLFNTHRNNKIITGAFGDTSAMKKIREMINDVIAAQKSSVISLTV